MLLPDPTKFKPPNDNAIDTQKQTVFFEHRELDEIAKHFIGNLNR